MIEVSQLPPIKAWSLPITPYSMITTWWLCDHWSKVFTREQGMCDHTPFFFTGVKCSYEFQLRWSEQGNVKSKGISNEKSCMHRNWHSEEFDYLFTPLKEPLPTLCSSAVTQLHSFLILPLSGITYPDIRNSSSVDCFKSSLIKNQHINDFISESHDYN